MKNNKFIYLIIGILIPIVLYFIFFTGNTCTKWVKIEYEDCSNIKDSRLKAKCTIDNISAGQKKCVEWR